MSSPRAGDVDGFYVAGDGELAGHDVLDGVDGGAESARHAQHDEEPAVHPLPYRQLPVIGRRFSLDAIA